MPTLSHYPPPILAKIKYSRKSPQSKYSSFFRKRKQIKFHRRAKLPAINATEGRHFLPQPLRDNMSCLQRCNAITMLRSPPRNRRINTIANYGAVHVLISSRAREPSRVTATRVSVHALPINQISNPSPPP